MDLSREYDQAVILTALSRIAVYFLSSLLRFNTLVQDIIVQMASDSGFGYLCLMFIRLYRYNGYLLLVAVVVFLLCLHFLGRAFCPPTKLKSLSSSSVAAAAAAALDFDEEMQARSEAVIRSPYQLIAAASPRLPAVVPPTMNSHQEIESDHSSISSLDPAAGPGGGDESSSDRSPFISFEGDEEGPWEISWKIWEEYDDDDEESGSGSDSGSDSESNSDSSADDSSSDFTNPFEDFQPPVLLLESSGRVWSADEEEEDVESND
jgi:hypothetical protein